MHRRSSAQSARLWRTCILSSAIVVTGWATTARSQPTVGFVENWSTAGNLATWNTGGLVTLSNPGTGGYRNDGFLMVSTASSSNLAAKSSGPDYVGDWTAAGITQVRVWLNDVNSAQALEIHFGLGRSQADLSANFWQYNVGLIPPFHAWGEYVVDLTSANWTQTHGSGTFAAARADVQTIQLRHDKSPFTSNPDPIAGDFGVDRLLLTNGVTGVEPISGVAVARPVLLAPPAPNPSRSAVDLSLEAFESGPIHLQIVDASGRVVRRAERAGRAPGRIVWRWDGADDRGRQVAPGYYRARAWSAAGGTSQPLVRVR